MRLLKGATEYMGVAVLTGKHDQHRSSEGRDAKCLAVDLTIQ